jgi:hypothetical protein
VGTSYRPSLGTFSWPRTSNSDHDGHRGHPPRPQQRPPPAWSDPSVSGVQCKRSGHRMDDRTVGAGHYLRARGHHLAAQRSANVLHQQDEVKLVSRAWLKLGDEVNVEVAGFDGFGMYE